VIAPVTFALANVFVAGLAVMTVWLLLSGRMYGQATTQK